MIVLDTHIWVWWVHGDKQLTKDQLDVIQASESDGIGMWEIAKLVELGRLMLPCPINEWFGQALSYPGMQVLDLTPKIAIESTQLPGQFHRDPADQIIVASARIYQCAIVTSDQKIIAYPHVEKAPPTR